MPKFDVFQKSWVNGFPFGESKVRMSGEDAPNAAVNWVKLHGVPKADRKNVRILGNSTKIIEVEYDVGDAQVKMELIPVESTTQCKDCGYPKDAPNETCFGGCEEARNKVDIPMDIDDANDLIQDMM